MYNNIIIPTADTATEWIKYIKEIAKDPENQHRKYLSKKCVDFYEGKQQLYFEQELKKVITDPISRASKRRWFQNYTKDITDTRSQSYQCVIKRNVGDLSPEENKVISDLVFTELDGTMNAADKFLNNERMALIYPRWNRRKQRVSYRTYHQYEYDLVFDPASQDRALLAVILSDYGCPADKTKHFVYTAQYTYQFLGERLVTQDPNPLQTVPFVYVYDGEPGSNDYLDPSDVLVNANNELNLAQANLLTICQNNAHPVPVLTLPASQPIIGEDEADPNRSFPQRTEADQRIPLNDASKAVVLRRDFDGNESKLEYLEQRVDFQGALEVIKYYARSLAQSFGGDINENQAGATATGFYVSEKRRQALLLDRRIIFKDVERELFTLAVSIASRETAFPAIRPEDFNIEFTPDTELNNNLTPEHLLAMLDKGVIDTAEFLRLTLYPSLDRAECEEKAKEFREAEAELDALTAPPTPQVPQNPLDPAQNAPNSDTAPEYGAVETQAVRLVALHRYM